MAFRTPLEHHPRGWIFLCIDFRSGLVDVGVDLRGLDVAVAEEFLHDAEIGAAAEEVGGEAVAQGMGRDLLEDSAFSRVLFDQHPQADAFHRLAGAGEEQSFAGFAFQFRAAFGEIAS